MNHFKDASHLFRFAGLFVVAFLVFLVVRGYVVPKTFGQYGHYRASAMGDIAAHPVAFAGHQACADCLLQRPGRIGTVRAALLRPMNYELRTVTQRKP